MTGTRPILRRSRRRHRSDPLPPPGRENWLGAGLMGSAAICAPLSVYASATPRGQIGLFVSLVPVIASVAFLAFLGLGMWLVRPTPGRRRLFRIAFVPLHLQGAVYLLYFGQAFSPRPQMPFGAPATAIDLTAAALTFLCFIPALVLWRRGRDGKMLFFVEAIVPGMFAAVFLVYVLPGTIVVLLRS